MSMISAWGATSASAARSGMLPPSPASAEGFGAKWRATPRTGEPGEVAFEVAAIPTNGKPAEVGRLSVRVGLPAEK